MNRPTPAQFATNKLGFRLEDISVYGWSIGGFTASWVGMNYKGLGAMGCRAIQCCRDISRI